MDLKRPTSKKFDACRERVHDDAFEAMLALHMASPLLSKGLSALKRDYLYQSGIFLRRALVRYLALVLCRLLDKPNERGRSGVTASIPSLLEMAASEGVLSEVQLERFCAVFARIKTDAAGEGYDLVRALRDLRTIQVAHSLIPHTDDPTEQVWAHDLLEFAEEIFEFVVNLEKALTDASGIALAELRKNAEAFEANAEQFWQALTAMPA